MRGDAGRVWIGLTVSRQRSRVGDAGACSNSAIRVRQAPASSSSLAGVLGPRGKITGHDGCCCRWQISPSNGSEMPGGFAVQPGVPSRRQGPLLPSVHSAAQDRQTRVRPEGRGGLLADVGVGARALGWIRRRYPPASHGLDDRRLPPSVSAFVAAMSRRRRARRAALAAGALVLVADGDHERPEQIHRSSQRRTSSRQSAPRRSR